MNEDTSKRAIEKVVNRAASALKAIAVTIEEHGKTIEHVDKSFAHLSQVLAVAYRRSQAAVLASNVTAESFSLDAPLTTGLLTIGEITAATPVLPPPPMQAEDFTAAISKVLVPEVGPRTQTTIAPQMPVAEKKWIKPEGRLVGTKEPVIPIEAPPARRKRVVEDADEVPDKTGAIVGAGFIDS